MNWKRIVSFTCAFALGLAAVADDGLLGKPRSGGSSGGGHHGSGGGGDRGDQGGNKGGNKGGGSPKNDSPPAQTRDSDQRQSGSNNGSGRSGNDGTASRRAGDDMIRSRGSSRSGQVRYGTNSNQYGSNQGSRRPDQNEASRRANREGDTHPNYRRGYTQYDRSWTDDWFSYPFYQFDYNDRCAFSPWYLYPQLPAYVSGVRIRVDLPHFSVSFDSRRCRWDVDDPYDRGSEDWALRNAAGDVRRMFERRDGRSLDRLLPDRGSVVIRNGYGQPYCVNTSDFYDMMMDNIYATRTVRYDILDTYVGRGGAEIVARHTFQDPWGGRDSVIHTYRLQEVWRDQYQIVEFGTSREDRRR